VTKDLRGTIATPVEGSITELVQAWAALRPSSAKGRFEASGEAGIVMMPFRLIAMDWNTSLPKLSSSFAATEPALSRVRRLPWTADLRLQALAYERCVPTSIPNSARAKISRVSRSDDAAPGLPSNYW
jgi:hypothetical protein